MLTFHLQMLAALFVFCLILAPTLGLIAGRGHGFVAGLQIAVPFAGTVTLIGVPSCAMSMAMLWIMQL
ncbi:MAG: hypothetical protein HY340_02155 [Candidatus Kerfeldbacteria bacterium]|nr:hypothetical protein [Candidatus Kerfeldbacteria bacterium]